MDDGGSTMVMDDGDGWHHEKYYFFNEFWSDWHGARVTGQRDGTLWEEPAITLARYSRFWRNKTRWKAGAESFPTVFVSSKTAITRGSYDRFFPQGSIGLTRDPCSVPVWPIYCYLYTLYYIVYKILQCIGILYCIIWLYYIFILYYIRYFNTITLLVL